MEASATEATIEKESTASPTIPLLAASGILDINAALSTNLVYVSDSFPGIRRVRHRDGFRYVSAEGVPVRDPEELKRVRSLAIPPAWQDVWISPVAGGHIQATGRDARGRKQYIYHSAWRRLRDETKFERLTTFGRLLPNVRRRVDRDLSKHGLKRERVLATVVRLLEVSLIRVGNREYQRANDTYGLTTLRQEHVGISGTRLRFEFTGKRGVRHSVGIRDRRLARVVSQLQELPGQELFHYHDEDGELQIVDSSEVNDYIRDLTGGDFTAKDFRTFAGTVTAAVALNEIGPFQSQTQAKRQIAKALDLVAQRLRNTRAICRKSYVHPAILESYMDGSLLEAIGDIPDEGPDGLRPEEAAVLRFLEGRTALAVAA
ncbi:MAG: DNA topoisomerase IB [Dehalococcoidia bacterium]